MLIPHIQGRHVICIAVLLVSALFGAGALAVTAKTSGIEARILWCAIDSNDDGDNLIIQCEDEQGNCSTSAAISRVTGPVAIPVMCEAAHSRTMLTDSVKLRIHEQRITVLSLGKVLIESSLSKERGTLVYDPSEPLSITLSVREGEQQKAQGRIDRCDVESDVAHR